MAASVSRWLQRENIVDAFQIARSKDSRSAVFYRPQADKFLIFHREFRQPAMCFHERSTIPLRTRVWADRAMKEFRKQGATEALEFSSL